MRLKSESFLFWAPLINKPIFSNVFLLDILVESVFHEKKTLLSNAIGSSFILNAFIRIKPLLLKSLKKSNT